MTSACIFLTGFATGGLLCLVVGFVLGRMDDANERADMIIPPLVTETPVIEEDATPCINWQRPCCWRRSMPRRRRER